MSSPQISSGLRLLGGCLVATLLAGCQLEKVPSLVGDSQSAATTAITGAGLLLGTVTTRASSTIAPGTVISELPLPNTIVLAGSKVDLVVSSGVTFGGVVASGSPVANNPGYALDAVTGTQIPFNTDANGNYTVDVFGYSGPFLIRVLGVSADGTPVNLYSLGSTTSTTVNVTPLSDLVLGYAAGVTSANLEATCIGKLPACPALLNGILASLTAANSAVVAAIPASVWSAFGITPTTFNAITTQFATTHTGVDGLLDALSIVPPATTGAGYTVSLLGATPTLLATIPTSGTAGTEGGTAVMSPAPTPTELAQATNLEAVEPEIQALFAKVTSIFASSQPTAAQVAALLAPNFLNDGASAVPFSAGFATNEPVGFIVAGGGVAPYSGAQYVGPAGTPPGPAITYDVNGCVTSIWVYTSASNTTIQLVDTIPATNAAGTCTGGTWLWAGNGRTYHSALNPSFNQVQTQLSVTGGTYTSGLSLNTLSNQTPDNPAATAPYTYVAIAGPGLTTVGAHQAGQADSDFIVLVAPPVPPAPAIVNVSNPILNTANFKIDPYYAGSAFLQSCAAILASGSSAYNSTTPCFDANLVAGSDYSIGFLDVTFNLLALEEQRVNISPAATVVPASYYPTITGISPAGVTGIAVGSTATSVTVTTTAPAGSIDGAVSLNYSITNVGTIFFNTVNATTGPTPVATVFSVSGLSLAPTNGFAGTDDFIGGIHVGTDYIF
jgi:hypothetical protein